MRRLTSTEIEKLASRKDVRRIAVENFLGTMGGLTEWEARANLGLDARLYKWNTATRRAIEMGIRLAVKSKLTQ